MRVMAKVSTVLRDYPDCIVLRPLMQHPSQTQNRRAGTVVLTNVSIAANIRGEVLEAHERRITPKQEIRSWPRMRYVNTLGSYVDVMTGEKVEQAKAVYMVGTKIYYLPAAA